jgi:hypothetical protein
MPPASQSTAGVSFSYFRAQALALQSARDALGDCLGRPLFTSDNCNSRNQKLEGDVAVVLTSSLARPPSQRRQMASIPAVAPAGASLPLPARMLWRLPAPWSRLLRTETSLLRRRLICQNC